MDVYLRLGSPKLKIALRRQRYREIAVLPGSGSGVKFSGFSALHSAECFTLLLQPTMGGEGGNMISAKLVNQVLLASLVFVEVILKTTHCWNSLSKLFVGVSLLRVRYDQIVLDFYYRTKTAKME